MAGSLNNAAMSLVSNFIGHKISANASKYSADQSKSAAIWSSVIHGASNIASSVVGSVGKIRGR